MNKARLIPTHAGENMNKARLIPLTDEDGYVLYDMEGLSIEFFNTHKEGLDYADKNGFELIPED